ncbi:DUF2806 domain-containing protein [Klebsiella grimontii]|uniref:DUF2806 domain-containing protein n=1 Tax=Klebsiella grimontii TaxID=2058152 RepID=UPI0015AA71FB|nr:DUF2806 domain-containing protein [Klebsiella grimontii]
MTDHNILAVVQKAAKPLYNIVKVTGPFLLAQSKTAVENYSDFKLNKARLEAISTLLQEEARNISEDRAKLRDKIINTKGLERARAQDDYNLLTKELNKLSTIDKVKDFISDDEIINVDREISDEWIDRFNQLASSLNEPWRKQLLANAFSCELKQPGSVNFIILNCIASFDERAFRLFGFLVNSSIRMYEVNILPTIEGNKIFEIDGEEYSMNSLMYYLSHLNLIKNDGNGTIDIENSKNKDVYLRYGRRVLKMSYPTPPARLPHRIGMIYFTTLGNDIAKFYTRETNSFGNENFDKFILEAKEKRYTYTEIEMSEELFLELGI